MPLHSVEMAFTAQAGIMANGGDKLFEVIPAQPCCNLRRKDDSLPIKTVGNTRKKERRAKWIFSDSHRNGHFENGTEFARWLFAVAGVCMPRWCKRAGLRRRTLRCVDD
jgi:hypothetical protein